MSTEASRRAIGTLPIDNGNDTFVYQGERYKVNGANTSPNGKTAVLYVQGYHPELGKSNPRSMGNNDETIVILRADKIPHVKRTKNPDGTIKEVYHCPTTGQLSGDKEIIGKQISLNGLNIEVYLPGSFPGIGKPHIGWSGYETLVELPVDYQLRISRQSQAKT